MAVKMAMPQILVRAKVAFEKTVLNLQDARTKTAFLALTVPAQSVIFNVVEDGIQFESFEEDVNWVAVSPGEGFKAVCLNKADNSPMYVVANRTLITQEKDANVGKPIDIRIPREGFNYYVKTGKIVVVSFQK